jgi:competence protein ComFC
MLNFLFPKECLVCLKVGSLLCNRCKKNLFPTLPNCYICKKLSNGYITHRGCKKQDSLESIITFWKYNEYSKKLIHNFKYKDRFQVSDFLFCLFEKKLEKIDFKNSLLIPLPSHKRKTLERGFNPTQLICQLIAKKFKIDVNYNLVFKKEMNISQASLEYEKRRENVKNIFGINEKEIQKVKKYKQIIILDDIITTGATINEVSSEMKKFLEKDIVIQGICLFQGSFRKKQMV